MSPLSNSPLQAEQNIVEETLKKINSYKGVIGIVICNGEGVPVKSVGFSQAESVQYAGLMNTLVMKVRTMKER